MPAAAAFPDPVVWQLPVFLQPVELPAQRLPQVVADGAAVLVVQVYRVHQLAVDVQLQLPGRRVAHPHGPGALVAVEMIQHGFGHLGVAVDRVQHLQSPVGWRFAAACLQPRHEAGRLVGEAEPHQRVQGERRIPDPGVPVVPVPGAADGFRQRRGGRRDQRSGRLVDQQLEHERGPLDHFPVAPLVPGAAQPAAPVGHGVRPAAGRPPPRPAAPAGRPTPAAGPVPPRAQGNRCGRGGPGHGEPLAGAQDQFGLGPGAGEHRATVVRRVHGVVLPPEVERRAAGDRENDGPADRPQPADQQRARDAPAGCRGGAAP